MLSLWPIFHWIIKKSIRTFVGKRQACTVIRFVAMRMSLCSHGLHFAYPLKTSRIHKRERKRERKAAVTLHTRKCLLIWQAPTYAERLFKLSSGCLSFLKRRIIRKRLPSIYGISIAASSCLHVISVGRPTYCMHQNSITLLCNSLLFIVVGQSTEVQMKTRGPELLLKSFQPFESTPQFSKLRLSAKAGPVNVFTGNVPMQLRELT